VTPEAQLLGPILSRLPISEEMGHPSEAIKGGPLVLAALSGVGRGGVGVGVEMGLICN
jgi:hypothetical protein